MRLSLDARWSALMQSYRLDHQDPWNRALHKVAIPMIASSIPIAATVVGLPLAAILVGVGGALQLVGHAFEGSWPSLFGNRRYLLVGLLWWIEETVPGRIETRPA